jgi:filamentous hemagglutinin family protein
VLLKVDPLLFFGKSEFAMMSSEKMSSRLADYWIILQRMGAIVVLSPLPFLLPSPVVAQSVTFDGSLGAARPLTGPNYRIQQNDGRSLGDNLFHSFRQLNLNTGESITFESAPNILNIFSRVTGGTPSVIDGLIETESRGASLFLLNPSGIVFGRNASLNVGRSFAASTADGIGFGDRGVFSAINPNEPSALLTIEPSAFLFNQTNSGAIENRSVAPAGLSPSGSNALGLRVTDGQTLLLVGGNVSIDGGGLNAFGGRIEIGGVAGTGIVHLTSEGGLNFSAKLARANIFLNQATITTTGGGGGSIAINARNLGISSGSSIEAGIAPNLGNINRQAGDITLSATENITIGKHTPEQRNLGIRGLNLISNNVLGQGQGGDIRIITGSLFVLNGGQLLAFNTGDRQGGHIVIQARRQAVFDGSLLVRNPDGTEQEFPSGASTLTAPNPFTMSQNYGRAGNIEISTGSLFVSNRASLSAGTRAQGNAGNVTIHARDGVSFDRAYAFSTAAENSTGRSGVIRITSRRLALTNGAEIQTLTNGQGNAGRIIIQARDAVSVDGFDPQDDAFKSSIVSSSEETARGRGGDVRIATAALSVSNRARLSAESLGQGNAGDVDINANDIRLTRGVITTQTSTRSGGNITLRGLDLLLLRQNSEVSTAAGTSQATGNGGNIAIDASRGAIAAVSSENNDISANSFSGRGGRIAIVAQNIFGLTSLSLSEIQALQGNNDLTQFDANRLPTSDITAISQTAPALSGEIVITTPDVDPTRGLVELPTTLVDRSQQIAQSCRFRDRAANQFIVTGRGGLPLSPDAPLRGDSIASPSWIALDPEIDPLSENNSGQLSGNAEEKAIVEADGWRADEQGRIVLMANSANGESSQEQLRNPLRPNVSCQNL